MRRTILVLGCAGLFAGSLVAETTTGRVVRSDGLPGSGAVVSAYSPESEAEQVSRLLSGQERAPLARVVAEQDGRFALELPAATNSRIVEIGIELEGAAPWANSVVAGEILGMAVLQTAPLDDGSVTLGGRPLAAATVIWRDRKGLPLWVVTTDARGRYRVPDPELWASTATVLAPEVGVRSGRHTVDPEVVWGSEGNVLDPEIDLAEGRLLMGRVVDDNGGVSGAEIAIAGWPQTIADEAGRFQVRVGPGANLLQARSGARYVESWVDREESATLRLGPPRTVRGRIVDPSGAGIEGAAVRLHSKPLDRGPNYSGTFRNLVTDHAGRFETSHVLPTSVSIWAEMMGYSFEENQKTYDLRLASPSEITLVATPSPTIEGIVLDVDGTPVVGALIFPNWSGEQLMYGLPESFERVTTSGPEGRFRIPAVESASVGEPWKWTIFASGRVPTEISAETPPAQVRLSSGTEATLRVTTEDGRPVPGATVAIVEGAPIWATPVHLVSSELHYRWFYRTNEKGVLRVRLRPGSHYLAVKAEGFAPTGIDHFEIDVAATKELAVILRPNAPIEGRVVFADDGTPIAGALVMVTGEDLHKRVQTNAQGYFEVPDLAAGAYSLELQGTGFLPAQPLRVRTPGKRVVLEVDRGFELSGVVLDEGSLSPIAGASVTSESVGTTTSLQRFAITDDQGRFSLAALPPGHTAVHARAEGFVSGKSNEVAMGSGDPSPPLEIRLRAGHALVGQVVDDSGGPIASATVSVTGGGILGRPSTQSEPDGSFRLAGLPRGSHEFKVDARGFAEQSVVVQLDAREQHREFVLSKGVALLGRVVDDLGDPIFQALVRATAGNERGSGSTDEAGAFEISALGQGKTWEVTGSKNQYRSQALQGVDPEDGRFEILLQRLPTGVVAGMVTGATTEQIPSLQVSVEGSGTTISGKVEGDGSFEITEAPAGDVKVRLSGQLPSEWMSETKRAFVQEADETRVDFDLTTRVTVGGRVLRGGVPQLRASVSFRDAHEAHNTTVKTRADGSFEVKIPVGLHDLSVRSTSSSPYRQRLEIQQPLTLEIEVQGAELRGRVVDSWSGEGLPLTTVELLSPDRVDGSSASRLASVKTGADGGFAMPEAPAGRLLVRATHPEFAARLIELDLPPGPSDPIEIALEPTEGLIVVLEDAATGSPLRGSIVVRDLADRVLWNGNPSPHAEGLRIPLGQGAYKVSASATGYASQTVRAQLPSPDPVRLRLTPGAAAVVHSESLDRRVVRLIAADGEEYVRCWCNQISAFSVEGSRTEIPHVAPGLYTLVVEELDGRITQYALELIEGQTTEIQIL